MPCLQWLASRTARGHSLPPLVAAILCRQLLHGYCLQARHKCTLPLAASAAALYLIQLLTCSSTSMHWTVTPGGTAATPPTTGGKAGAGAAAAAAEGRRLRDALSRVGVMGSEVARTNFATKHLEQDLARLLMVSERIPMVCASCRVHIAQYELYVYVICMASHAYAVLIISCSPSAVDVTINTPCRVLKRAAPGCWEQPCACCCLPPA
jgi:hypothetical protein